MSVYAWCQKCDRRRDATNRGGLACSDKLGHKRYVGWNADVRFGAGNKGKRLRKLFGPELANPKEMADHQARAWKTDYERGLLKIINPGKSVVVKFSDVADEWWTQAVTVQSRIKDPNRSEKSRFDMWKNRFGEKILRDDVTETDEHLCLTLNDAEEWLTERREAGIAVNTINRDLKPLRWILDYAVEKRYIKENPLGRLKALKGGNIHDRWMTEEEVGRLIQAAIDLGDMDLADFIAVGVNTGFRLGNLERLTSRDIEGDMILARQTKSGDPYSVPIAPDIEPVLRRLIYHHPTGPLLIGRSNNVGIRFREAAAKAGLWRDKDDLDRVTIHTLRHTFAVLYLRRGGDIYRLKELLGHASVAITDRIYARFCSKEKLKEAARISTAIPQLQPQLKVV